MPHDPTNRSSRDATTFPAAYDVLVVSLYAESRAAAWGLTQSQFAAGLERSARKRFNFPSVWPQGLFEYLKSLYLEDLALACACMEGSEAAWDYFVREYRGYLRAAAGAVTKGSRSGADAHEFADSLFAELYGLVDGKRGEHSLFRYFHGRSSLRTWLRAVLAQRHINRVRESRRWEPYDVADGAEPKMLAPDPHRGSYVARFVSAMETALGALAPDDRRRLELYYARQLTLAEVGRTLGEHESSVSRNLERCRRELRAGIEAHLRKPPSLSDAEIALCFQYAAEDVPIDFRSLFPCKTAGHSDTSRKESS